MGRGLRVFQKFLERAPRPAHQDSAENPKVCRDWMPNAKYGGHAFGVTVMGNRDGAFGEFLARRESLMKWITEYSPISHVSKDDPPIFLEYPSQKKPPVKGEEQADPTHSALRMRFSLQLAVSRREHASSSRESRSKC